MAMTTGTQGWHADPTLLSSYLAGDLDAVTGASVEQHVSRCQACRAAVGQLLDPQLVERTWSGIRDAVERPPLPYPLRLARRCGLPEPTAVLLAAAASLRGAWLVGAFLSLSFATMAAYVSGGTALAPFLLAAPLAPVLGVAAAYGPRQDPLEALVATAPYGRTRLILLRTIAVLVSVLPGTALLGLAVPGPPWLAAAWLGPALALVPVLLALAGFVGPRSAATVVSLGWSGVVLASTRGLDPTWPVEAAQQGVYLALAVAACAVIALRSGTDRQRGMAL
jgi:putative zinc finger protein